MGARRTQKMEQTQLCGATNTVGIFQRSSVMARSICWCYWEETLNCESSEKIALKTKCNTFPSSSCPISSLPPPAPISFSLPLLPALSSYSICTPRLLASAPTIIHIMKCACSQGMAQILSSAA